MSNTRLRASDPVLVAVSDPGETRWGYHQFPALTMLPDRRILLTYANAEDASESHGRPAPAFVSNDGRKWEPFHGEPEPIRPHFAISPVGDGEYLACPASKYFDLARRDEVSGETLRGSAEETDVEAVASTVLPAPVAISNVYGTLYTYRYSDLPADAQRDLHELAALRYTPATGAWNREIIRYDLSDRLAWRRENSPLLPRPFFERSVTQHDGELLYPDYRVRFALPDGRISPKGCTWLMASADNGHTFERRGLVAVDPSGHDLHGEPTIEVTSDGGLVCVVRRTDHVQKPMAITWSHDGGRTWTPALDLFNFGVFPCLLRLGRGALLLSYGRPGVHVAVSYDGDGRSWDDVTTIVGGDPKNVSLHSCGYTSMLALADDRALIAHSDFDYVGSTGERHKAVYVREVTVG
jgi:hypothetical protein